MILADSFVGIIKYEISVIVTDTPGETKIHLRLFEKVSLNTRKSSS